MGGTLPSLCCTVPVVGCNLIRNTALFSGKKSGLTVASLTLYLCLRFPGAARFKYHKACSFRCPQGTCLHAGRLLGPAHQMQRSLGTTDEVSACHLGASGSSNHRFCILTAMLLFTLTLVTLSPIASSWTHWWSMSHVSGQWRELKIELLSSRGCDQQHKIQLETSH